jgi:ubiquinone/menaquinone biosynthesis C-methylase UbiE
MEKDRTYVIDNESGAEMARLIDQERRITRAMGGLLPPDFEPAPGKMVVDLACGPGGWAQEVAFAHPEMHVLGIDISQKMIDYAQSIAQAKRIANLHFELGDVHLLPLDFPDNSFDLINTRLITGFMFKDDWTKFVQECMRLLRPGGTVRFTESDQVANTTSPAFEKMQAILSEHGYRTKRASRLSDMGITIRLPHLLRRAGYEQIQVQPQVIDWSIDTQEWDAFRQVIEIVFKLLQPYAVQAGSTEEEWNELWEQMRREFYDEDFCAFVNLVSAWGRKPL